MKVLITGGAGYLGSELIKTLSLNPEVSEIVVYDNLSRGDFSLFLGGKKNHNSKTRFIQGDILDTRGLKKALVGVDLVYHLAAKVTTPFANVDPHYYEQVNHWGTAELVYAVEESDVKHLVYTSSIGVYGATGEEVVESTIPNPRTFYGISKMRGEKHVNRLSSRIKTHIIRCGNVFGYNRGMRFDAVINKFAFEAKFKGRIQIHGDGQQTRSFIHIDKVSKGLSALSTSDLPGGTYNFVEHNLSILDIVDDLKLLVPGLEFIFVNQDLSLRKIRVKPNEQLNALANGDQIKGTFRQELEELLSHLGF